MPFLLMFTSTCSMRHSIIAAPSVREVHNARETMDHSTDCPYLASRLPLHQAVQPAHCYDVPPWLTKRRNVRRVATAGSNAGHA